MPILPNSEALLEPLKRLHDNIRQTVLDACERMSLESVAAIAREEEGDTIYAVDYLTEDLLIDFFARELAPLAPLVLIAEGLPNGQIVLPRGSSEETAVWRIIVDPIDGTRGLMYQKRSAWILTGVAQNRGPETNLSDIELAIQTEIPLVKQHLSDRLWAIRGKGTHAERFNRLSKETSEIRLQPSRARSIAHGYTEIARFFPGAREELAAIDEEIVFGALGAVLPGKAHCFEDQYASSGGQLYELMSGHDRFIADLRPLMEKVLASRGITLGICAHPYDLCTELIARQAGVIVTDVRGERLSSPLDVGADVGWAGYANEDIRAQIEPLLQGALQRRSLG
jgi:fructose-1,6-bisphosphatase/inositol monophosphatase family enzyme